MSVATTKIVKRDGEYRVKLYLDGKYQKDHDYFTDDKTDANATAEDIARRHNATRQPTVLETLESLVEMFEESHADEMNSDHFGDGPAGCSYCKAIAAAKEVIKTAKGE